LAPYFFGRKRGRDFSPPFFFCVIPAKAGI
jgi:hypothetical protein